MLAKECVGQQTVLCKPVVGKREQLFAVFPSYFLTLQTGVSSKGTQIDLVTSKTMSVLQPCILPEEAVIKAVTDKF